MGKSADKVMMRLAARQLAALSQIVHVKSYMREGHPVKAYVRGGGNGQIEGQPVLPFKVSPYFQAVKYRIRSAAEMTTTARLRKAYSSGIAKIYRISKKVGSGSSDIEASGSARVSFKDGTQGITRWDWKGGLAAADSQDALSQVVGDAVGAPIAQGYTTDSGSLITELVPGEVAMDFVDRRFGTSISALAPMMKFMRSPEAHALGLFDYATAQGDRHFGNWLVTPEGHIVGIDHNLSWTGATTSPFTQVNEGTYTPAEIKDFMAKVRSVKTKFSGNRQLYRLMMQRLQYMLDHNGAYDPGWYYPRFFNPDDLHSILGDQRNVALSQLEHVKAHTREGHRVRAYIRGGGNHVVALLKYPHASYGELGSKGKAAIDAVKQKYGISQSSLDAAVRKNWAEHPAEAKAGSTWYTTDGRKFSDAMAKRYGVPEDVAVGVTAATSPRARWAKTDGSPGANQLATAAILANRDRMTTGDWAKLSNAEVVALLPHFIMNQFTEDGVAVARGNPISQHVTGVKRTAFYNDLADPSNGFDAPVDTYMSRIAGYAATKGSGPGGVLSGVEVERVLGANHLATNGGDGHVLVGDALRRVAKELGLTPAQVQAGWWVVEKHFHPTYAGGVQGVDHNAK